jgi:hypothetical protein
MARAPGLWKELEGALESKIGALNHSLGEQALDFREVDLETLAIRLKNQTDKVSVRFDAQKLSVDAHTINTGFDWKAAIVNGRVSFVSRQLGSMTPDQVAAHILDYISKFL